MIPFFFFGFFDPVAVEIPQDPPAIIQGSGGIEDDEADFLVSIYEQRKKYDELQSSKKIKLDLTIPAAKTKHVEVVAPVITTETPVIQAEQAQVTIPALDITNIKNTQREINRELKAISEESKKNKALIEHKAIEKQEKEKKLEAQQALDGQVLLAMYMEFFED